MEYGLISVFGAGLLTFVTPCVLPLVPIYLTVLAGGSLESRTGSSRGRLMVRALLFSVGFTSVFTMMGLSASVMSSYLGEHGGLIQVAGAAIVLVFALKFMGIVNVPFLDRIVKADDSKLQTRFAGINAVVMGVVFATGWSPCVGPVLGSVLTYTAMTSSNPWVGAGYLSVYGLGFALPLLLTAAFAEAGLRLVGRISAYLPRIERGIGVLMLALAGYLAVGAYDSFEAKTVNASRIETLSELLDGSVENGTRLPAMVELYTADCTACKQMKPVLEHIYKQCDNNGVKVKTIDVSLPENRHLPGQLQVVGVPTFLFVDESGKEMARLVGQQTESALKQGLSALRGKPCPGMTLLLPDNAARENTDNSMCSPDKNSKESASKTC